ncbi:hypothetical protein DDP54_06265 [Cellulomonas sp. WB94]|uniref:hypothetical protein n=1 Tax=Cellulomonas sp. WB94 TaxID=2173174 RepID=UPI000D56C297|nr:hypothetical protein [Cellulomonas sp. WB94]PVU82679.1 hypothetical protein DDP54_06265 [Cellulomonas sp. WB94]
MPLPPDDIPASPTGRVPQWVLDEAAARSAEPPGLRVAWSAPPAPPAPARRSGRVPTSVTVSLVVVAALAGASWLTANLPAASRDLASALQPVSAPAPSPAVVALADEAHLSPDGRDLFYGAHPEILDRQAFAGRCVDGPARPAVSAGSAVGCFFEGPSSIVLFEPADPRLHGSVVETAAHETLHAAWAQLSTDEQPRLAALLESEVLALAADDPIHEQIDASVGTHPESRPTELFAYVGTQVWRPGGISAQLEATYARFISDRAALVAVHTGWQGLLDGMGTEIQTAWDALAVRDAANAQRRAQHTADAASVDYYREAYRAKAAEVAAMPASQRQRLRLSWVWWDGTELPMAPAEQTLADAAALLARDDAALPAQEAAIQADEATASQEHARVDGLIADLEALQAMLDPATSPATATSAT